MENKNDFEYFQIIDIDRSVSFIRKPENDVVDHNYKSVLISYVSNDDILG